MSIENNGKSVARSVHPEEVKTMPHDVVIDGSYPVHIEVAVDKDYRPLQIAITVRSNIDERALAAHVDTFMLLCNLALAHKLPIEQVAAWHLNLDLYPKGTTDNDEIKHTSSVFDYISRWLGHTYGLPGFLTRNPLKPGSAVPADPFIEEMR